MEKTCEQYAALRDAVEKVINRKMMTPRDFDFLAMRIYDVTHTQLSPTTLKRFWNYIDKDKMNIPRLFTLSTLALFAGYKDWNVFCVMLDVKDKSNSDFVRSQQLYATSLKVGDCVRLMWSPNRCIVVKYMGEDMFEVVASQNSKLMEKDRFCCGCFIDGEPLYLNRLVRADEVIGAYVCGQEDGVKFILENKGR